MPLAKQSVLRFLLRTSEHPLKVMDRFHPHGKPVLNSTEWRGKEPRSCGITKVHGASQPVGSTETLAFDVEVNYRPKGCITFTGTTKYDGWTAMVLDKAKNGTLLDGHGKPLADGEPPVYLHYEVYDALDFNEIDFGEFIGEFDVETVRHVRWDDVMRQVEQSPHIALGITSTFMAPRRYRPLVKIALSNAPGGTGTDGWGTRIINVNNSTPHLRNVLLDHLTEILSGFVEGRYSMNCVSNGDVVVVVLTDTLVDCTPNEEGKESRFDCLREYVPDDLIAELAGRLTATYAVEVDVVDGQKVALLFRPSVSK